MISSREESVYIDCGAVEIVRCPGVVVVVIDHHPPRVSSEAEPGLDRRYHLIEISVQVHIGKRTGGRPAILVLEDMLGDIAKTQFKRILIICVQPEDCCISCLIPFGIFDGQLSLSDPSQTVKNDSRSRLVTMQQPVHLGQLVIPPNELHSFGYDREVEADGELIVIIT
jgi:hypothetical protein